jgi:3-phenylpropionate/cinnamic acid dioxygenase small subunit
MMIISLSIDGRESHRRRATPTYDARPVDSDDLVDRQAIVDVCTSYALALDSRDWARLRACFTEDAVADYGDSGASEGYEAIETTCRAALEPLSASQHLLGNHLVRLEGDGADSTCYFQAQHVMEGLAAGTQYVVAGRYDDRLVRTPSGWRISHRTLSVMWTSGNPDVLARDS